MSDFFSFARYETTGGKKMQKRPIPFTDPYGSRYLYQIPQRCSVSTEILSFALRTERGFSSREKVDRARLRESVFHLASKSLGKGRNVDGSNERRTRTSERVRRPSARIVDRRLTRSVVRIFNSSTIEIRRVRRNTGGEKANRRLAKGERKRCATLHPFSLHLRFEY